MTINFSGKQLHTLMIKNNKGLIRSAQKLEMTPEQLNEYLNYEFFEEDLLLYIFEKLKIYFVIDEPGAVTPLALKQFEIYESRIKLLKTVINELNTVRNDMFVVLEKLQIASIDLQPVLLAHLKLKVSEHNETVNKMIDQINLK